MSYLTDGRIEELRNNNKSVLVRIHSVSCLLLSGITVAFWVYHPGAFPKLIVEVHNFNVDPWFVLKLSSATSAFTSFLFAWQVYNSKDNIQVESVYRWIDAAITGALDIVVLGLICGFRYAVTIVSIIALYFNSIAAYQSIETALTLLPSKREKLLNLMTFTAIANLSVISIILFYYLSHAEQAGMLYSWALAIVFVFYSFIEWGFSLSHSVATGIFHGPFFVYLVTIQKLCYRITFYLVGLTAVLARVDIHPQFALGDILLLSSFVPFVILFFSVFALYPTDPAPEQLNKKSDFTLANMKPVSSIPSQTRVKFVL